MKQVFILLAPLILLASCQSTYKVVVENDLNRKEVVRRTANSSHVIASVININDHAAESVMCQSGQWRYVSLEQAPLFSGLRLAETLVNGGFNLLRATNATSQQWSTYGLLTVYSQLDSKWACSN